MSDVTVITPTIPERAELLAEAVNSVARQTVPAAAHFIGVDRARNGPFAVRNELLHAAQTEWVAPLDDDDLFHPDHLERLLAAPEADVVYSWWRIEGRPANIPRPERFDAELLRRRNYIPCTGIIRRSLAVEVGGFQPVRADSGGRHAGYGEDWGLWLALLDRGARFEIVTEETWTYRRGDWPSRQQRNL